MTAGDTIKNYILENYLFTTDQSALDITDSFLDKGILDSTGILEMISFVEQNFGIKVEDDEMVPENLDSVESLVAFIDGKK